MLTATHRGELVYYGENPGGTVAVIEQAATQDSFRRLYIQGVSNSGDAMPSLRYMRLQALLPLLIQRDEPRSALVVALGTGITAGALTQYPGLERRACVELLPAVVDAAKLFHGNYQVTGDPRVDIRVRDGRRELLRDTARYDLITLEPPPPSAAGVANLYSRDFYELARSRLQPGGLFAQWLPLATQNNEDTRALVRSFLDTFPYATLWTTELHEMLLVGSLQPIELNAEHIAQRFAQPSVSQSLGEVGIDSPAALLATWMMDRDGLEKYAATAEPVTDDRPRIEYAQWLRRGEFARVLPQLLALRSAPPLRATPEFNAQVDAEWNHLRTFYEAGLHAYRGDRASWSDALGSIAAEIDSNPYYRWTIKGF
jgi:spermidine synthase